MKIAGKLFFAMILLLGLIPLSHAADCTPKTDYDETISCSEKIFIARTSSELDLYQNHFGLEEGKYKSLRIAFDIDETDITVHSPCSIYIRSGTTLSSDAVCLDAKKDIGIDGVIMNATDSIKMISQEGNISLRGRSSFISTENVFTFSKRLRAHRDSNIRIRGSLSASSTGSPLQNAIHIASRSLLNTESINFSVPGQIFLGGGSQINSSGTVTLNSTGTDAYSHINLKDTGLTAQSIVLTSGNRLGINLKTRINAGSLKASARGCFISPRTTFNDSILKEGSCLTKTANRYPYSVKITSDRLIGPAPLTVNFTGAAQDKDGRIVSYLWDFGDGAKTIGKTSFHTYNTVGKYIVTMVATDDDGAKSPARVKVQVGGNLPPVANAGPDLDIIKGKKFSLSGTLSTDPENDPLGYSWKLIKKPSSSMAILGNPSSVDPFFVPDQNGSYTFTLIVNDGEHSSTEDQVVLTASTPANTAPVLSSIGNKSVALGDELKFTLSGSDSDNDPLDYRVEPVPLLKNARFNARTGEFIFKPDRSQTGTHDLKFSLFDGKDRISETIRITVTEPSTPQMTRLTGKILDTNAMTGNEQEIPVVGATVSILVDNLPVSTARTGSTGEFTLNAIPDSKSHVLKINASTAQPGPKGARYADFIEPFVLISGVDNRVPRPFFLPRIDMGSSTEVVAGQETEVNNTALGVDLSIPGDAITNEDGTTFTGNITVSEVPRNLAPVSLPEQFNPSMLVTIQPAGIRFTTPAQISFPNSARLDPGAEVGIYSIDPDTGAFVVTGRGRVSADGAKIETVSGGIMGATWHFPSPDPVDVEPDDDDGNEDCDDSGCDEDEEDPCQEGCPDVGSSVPIAQGFLLESHNLATYRSLGVERGVRLSYNSSSAYLRPIVSATALTVLRSIPENLSIKLLIAGEEKPNTFYTATGSLDGGTRRPVRQKIYYDADNLETGLYPYELHITAHFFDDSSTMAMESGKTMIINQQSSRFGSGWSLENRDRLHIDSDGDIMLVFGNSDRKRFLVQKDGSYTSPRGDYSRLQKIGSQYIRTLKDGTRYIFRSDGFLIKIEDRNKNITLYCYEDGTSRLKYIEDPMGKRTHFTYNSSGKVETIKDPAERVARLSYSNEGDLILITNPDGSSRSFMYDSEHRLIGQQRENGKISNYIYNDLGRIVNSTVSDGSSFTMEPVASSGLLEVMEGMGTPGNPLGHTLERDEQGSITDRNGNKTILKVNSFGSEIERTDARGNTTTTERDENNNIIRIVDVLGRVTENQFDNRGNLLSKTNRQTGEVTRYTYEPRYNRVASIQNPKGDRTELTYDRRGNLLTRTTDNRVTRYTYTSSGQIQTQTNPNGNIYKSFYNSNNGLLSESSDPLGNTTRYEYDPAGNLVKEIDGRGNQTKFEYDLMNRLIKTTDTKSGMTFFSYDTVGNMLSATDASGNTTAFEYDRENRLTLRRDALGREERFYYDFSGNLTRRVNRDGRSITYRYDELNRLVQKDMGRDRVSYGYDAVGNLISITDNDSNLLYTYNSRDQILTASTEGSPFQPSVSLSYSYDLNGNHTGLTTPFGKIDYTYDDLNRQTGIVHNGNQFTFTFDADSRLTGKTYPNGFRTEYHYDESSRLSALSHKNNEDDIIAGFRYAYDKTGNRVEKEVLRPGLPLNSKLRYSYDRLNRLIGATHPDPNISTETFSYDQTGNRLKRDGDTSDSLFNAGNQLLSDKDYTYRYDLNGNLSEKRHKIRGSFTLYGWSRENRLIEIYQYPGNNAPVSKRISYRYDGLGRRIEKRIRAREKPTEVIRFIYDEEDILAEYDKDDNLQAGYIHGAGIDNNLSVIQGENSYYYHEDALGSVVLLTNELGAPVQHYAYDAYGKMKIYGATGLELSFDNAPIGNFYTYTGREYDNESGLYYYRARFYSPRAGRFLSEDPIGFSGGDFNLYRYVFNNPVNFIDPTGTEQERVLCIKLESQDMFRCFTAKPGDNEGDTGSLNPIGTYTFRGEGSNRLLFSNMNDFDNFVDQGEDAPEPCE